MIEFFAMGGYAGYVWSAVGISALVMGVNVWAAHRSHRQILVTLRRRAQVERSQR